MNHWDVYFASLCGWMLHPGYSKPGTPRPTLEQIAEMADQMEEIRNARMGSCGSGSG